MGKPKKGKKKNDDWEDDVLNELETLKDGDEGTKKDQPAPPQKPNLFQALDVEEENDEEDDFSMDSSGGKKKKEKNKEKVDNSAESKELSKNDDTTKNGSAQLETETVNKEMNLDEDDFDMGSSSKKSKKGKKSKKDVDLSELADTGEEPTDEPIKKETNKQKQDDVDTMKGDDEDEPVIKTAAQKKAEKKEREKKKKAQEKERQKQKSAKKADKGTDEMPSETTEGEGPVEKAAAEKSVKEDSKEPEPAKKQETPSDDKTEEDKTGEAADKEKAGEEKDDDEGGEAAEGDKKKKKKKKKKKAAEEEETKKVKKPNKALVKQMQQQLEQLRLEEERLRQAEEEKIRLREEAEEKRLEKIRLEQERKDKKKQKEKERKARLKQEGKLLTKSQKEQRAKQQAMLEAMKQQGIEIPGLKAEEQEGVRKPVRYGVRKKNKPQQQEQQPQEQQQQQEQEKQEDKEAVESKVERQESEESEQQTDEPKEESEKEQEMEIPKEPEKPEEIKDAWDMESDEEGAPHKVKTKAEKEEPKVRKKSEGSSAENEEESESEEESEDEDEGDEEEEEESESEEDEESSEDDKNETVAARINKRRVRAELNRSTENLRSPVICVLGHVDTGKTKILDKIRHTHVQDGEAGGITQQIGATMVPVDAVKTQTKMVKEFQEFDIKLPGLLIIDTPGHESFSNLRSRGSSLCDMAILVVDIMHGLEPQTIESLNLLKKKKTPFVVALNKVDRLFEWKRGPDSSIINTIKKQKRNTKQEFEERVSITVKEFAEQGLNACLFYDNKDTRSYVSLIPTSAHSGDGMGDLISQIVKLTQTRLAQRLSYSEELEGMILEVKAIPGLGTTIDVILVNGTLREGDTIIVPGYDGPIVTQIRALLTPQPLKELRIKSQYINHKELKGAQGVKIAAKDLEKTLAGIPLMVAQREDEIEYCKQEVANAVSDALRSIHLSDRGVYVQASTLGSLEALLEFLKVSKIPYAGVNIGPVHKKDVMKCSIMLEHDVQFAVILAFDVKIEREAQELADSLGVKIFSADIIYHLFDKFTQYREEQKMKKREEFRSIAVFPCKLRVLPQHIYNTRDPIVMGVSIDSGILREGTPVCVPSKGFVDVGVVTGIEANHKSLESATKGMEVCVKIEATPGDAPKLYGRHFDHQDLLVSKISRTSIDAVKNYFRDDLQKSDWQLMIELKKLFEIM